MKSLKTAASFHAAGAMPEPWVLRATALVPPGDPGALASMILELMADPARRAAIGEAGRKRVVDLYSWQATATRTVEQYRALLAETKVKPRDAHV